MNIITKPEIKEICNGEIQDFLLDLRRCQDFIINAITYKEATAAQGGRKKS